jgi:hypothetical protein
MFEILEGEILYKVQKYEIFRKGEGRLLIDVLEVVAPTPKKEVMFVAAPNNVASYAGEKYCGYGPSETEALKDCLTKIKGVSREQIIPSV